MENDTITDNTSITVELFNKSSLQLPLTLQSTNVYKGQVKPNKLKKLWKALAKSKGIPLSLKNLVPKVLFNIVYTSKAQPDNKLVFSIDATNEDIFLNYEVDVDDAKISISFTDFGQDILKQVS